MREDVVTKVDQTPLWSEESVIIKDKEWWPNTMHETVCSGHEVSLVYHTDD